MNRGTTMQSGEGERLHAERRKRFWTILGGLALAGGVAGFFSGFIAGYSDASEAALPQWLLTAASAAIVLAALAGLYGSYRFFVTVDEVELADNLWGSLVGFYAYAFLFPVWWLLNKLGQAPVPNDWLIFAVAMAAALAAYAFRKWQSR